MIDWLNLLFNSIWILALALALSVVSIAYWEAQIGGKKLRALLGQYRYALPLILAGVVFCLGMAATSAKWWEWIFWEISVVLFGIQGWVINKDRGLGTGDGEQEEVLRLETEDKGRG